MDGEDVGRGRLCDIVVDIEGKRVGESLLLGPCEDAAVVRVKRARFRLGQRHVLPGAAVRGDRQRIVGDKEHWELLDADAACRRVRFQFDQAFGAVPGPHHGPDVEGGVPGLEALDPLKADLQQFLGGDVRDHPEGFRGPDQPLAVEVQIRGEAIEPTGAVEHPARQPRAVVGRRDDRVVAFVPISLKPCEAFAA